MIISVDHGNKSVKTPNLLFTSGLIESESKPGITSDCVYWKGKYYFLTEKRIPYLRDKTVDDRFYVLTLFAIAQELERAGIQQSEDTVGITLLVGLPPAHYGQLHEKFEQYFLRKKEVVDFEYNDRYYSIRIEKVVSYTQALAAASTRFGDLKNHAVSYVIDIGGYTVDVLKLRNGKPDLAVVESFEKGTITLYNSIASQCNAQFALHLEDCDIDEVIKGEPTILPGEVQMLIRTMTTQFLSEFFNFLGERGVDVKVSKNWICFNNPMLAAIIHEKTHWEDTTASRRFFAAPWPEENALIFDLTRPVPPRKRILNLSADDILRTYERAAQPMYPVVYGRPTASVVDANFVPVSS